MQRMELAFLGALPANQRSLLTEGQPAITKIDVKDVAESDNRMEGQKE